MSCFLYIWRKVFTHNSDTEEEYLILNQKDKMKDICTILNAGKQYS